MVDIIYPEGPYPPARENPKAMTMIQGQGINAAPFEAEKIMDLTLPLGKGSGMVYGLCFQFGKWGYDSAKLDHAIEVSPVFTEYYSKVMGEKGKLEAEIKQGFASVLQAVQDFELIDHDLRKYKEHLDRFKELEEAKKKKDEKEITKAEHVLKATFVDEVDAHTGEGISLRSIAPRWPTIISDFLDLHDEDDTPEKVMARVKEITRPEAVILTTKNKLYIQWRELFFSTIIARYERLKMLAASRKASIKEYRENMRSLISRYKAMPEIRESHGSRARLGRIAWFRPDSQAVSLDTTTIWAWKPFVVEEVFKAPREEYEKISLQKAGFNKEEIEGLMEKGITSVSALPAKPIVDKFVREIIKQIEQPLPNGYGVEITPKDIVDEIEELSKKFEHPERPSGLAMGPRWPFSPYYIFIQLTILRGVFKLPDGSTMEDLWIEPFKAWNVSQNIMLGRLLELRAKAKAAENEISILVGDIDTDKLKEIDKLIQEEYPEFYGKEKKEEKKRESPFKKISENVNKTNQFFSGLRTGVASFLSKLGIHLMFMYPGPYEKFMHERMTKMMQRGPGIAFSTVDNWLKRAAGVMSVHEVETK